MGKKHRAKGLKKYRKLYAKERREHPSFSAFAIRRIVKDHWKKRKKK